ncbi:hypothetical protein ACFSTA_01150 [Ornithinibacillus salinisoli]|uniref:DUF3021 domain-containing protein n=1 Tax=Ornithinibacillus salinisoli TaxID=1848459 RepID=A0ABW4VWK3_9BACI
MIKRKFVSAVIATYMALTIFMIFSSGIPLKFNLSEFIGAIGFQSLVAAPSVLLFGIPISILSDFITKRLKGGIRQLSSLIIHITSASLYIVFVQEITNSVWTTMNLLGFRVNEFLFIAVLISLFLWLLDEISKNRTIITKLNIRQVDIEKEEEKKTI